MANSTVKFSADGVKALFAQQRVFTKVVKAADGDDEHLHFNLDQLADPKNIRPIKKMRDKADRTKIRNLVTGQKESRVVNEDRGRPKDTPFTKKTSLSKPPADGKMFHFADDTYVGFIFEHDDYDSQYHVQDRLVKLPRDQKTHRPKFVFVENEVTNNRFWIEGQPDFERPTQSVLISDLANRNATIRANGQIPRHNEILGCPSKAALRGVFVPKIQLNQQLLVAPKLNAIRVKYMIQSRLGLDVPVLIMTPETGVIKYPFAEQVKDIVDGLNAVPDAHRYRYDFANEILERAFLENDGIWQALSHGHHADAIRKGSSAARFALLQAMKLLRSDPVMFKNELVKLDKLPIQYGHAIKLVIEFIAQNKIDLAYIDFLFQGRKIPRLAIEALIQEKRFTALDYALVGILRNGITSQEKQTIIQKLIQLQQYNLVLKILKYSADEKFAEIKDARNNNALHQLFVRSYPNLRPSTELMRTLAVTHSVTAENADKRMPIELAILQEDSVSAEYFLTQHFDQFNADQLFRIMVALCEVKQFALLSKYYQKFTDNKEVKIKFVKRLSEYRPGSSDSLAMQMLKQCHPSRQADSTMLLEIANTSPFYLVYQYNQKGESALTLAIDRQNWEVVQCLIQDRNLFYIANFAPKRAHLLNLLITHHQPRLAKALRDTAEASLKYRPEERQLEQLNPNLVAMNGNYPIHLALLDEKPDNAFVKHLCEDKPTADLKLKGAGHQDVLTLAYESKNWEILSYFIQDHFAELDLKDILRLLKKILIKKDDPSAQQLAAEILNHPLMQAQFKDPTIVQRLCEGELPANQSTVVLPVLRKRIDLMDNPLDVISFIDDLAEAEKRHPVFKSSRGMTLNRWKNESVSNEWLDLIGHAKKHILFLVAKTPGAVEEPIKNPLRLFLGATTRCGLFADKVAAEKASFDVILKQHELSLESSWEMVVP